MSRLPRLQDQYAHMQPSRVGAPSTKDARPGSLKYSSYPFRFAISGRSLFPAQFLYERGARKQTTRWPLFFQLPPPGSRQAPKSTQIVGNSTGVLIVAIRQPAMSSPLARAASHLVPHRPYPADFKKSNFGCYLLRAPIGGARIGSVGVVTPTGVNEAAASVLRGETEVFAVNGGSKRIIFLGRLRSHAMNCQGPPSWTSTSLRASYGLSVLVFVVRASIL